jgi:hypothetical protein
MTKSRSLLTLAILAASLTASDASAQSLLPEGPAKGLWMEGSRTSFWVFDQEVPTAVWFLGGRLPVSGRVSAVFDIPFSHARIDLMGSSKSSSVAGNPYLGVEFRASPELVVSMSTRLPLTSADDESFADVLAILADPQRLEAFAMHAVPASVFAAYTGQLAPGLSLRAHGGTTRIFRTRKDLPDPDTMLDYGLMTTYDWKSVRTGLGLSGRWNTTARDASNQSDDSINYTALTLDLRVGSVRPGLSARVPMDSDHRNLAGASLGLYLQIPLR